MGDKKEELKEVFGLEYWEPLPNEVVRGIITESEDGTYGKEWVILKEDGSVIKTPAHKMLQNKLLNCKIGDMVEIRVGEKKDTKKGNPLQLYRVFEIIKK